MLIVKLFCYLIIIDKIRINVFLYHKSMSYILNYTIKNIFVSK